MLEIVAKNGRLSDLLERIPQYSQFKTKTPCPDKKKESVMAKLAVTADGIRVDTTDGVKIFLEDGWVLVRPSGTEPIFRVFTEAKTPERAESLAGMYKKRVRPADQGLKRLSACPCPPSI